MYMLLSYLLLISVSLALTGYPRADSGSGIGRDPCNQSVVERNVLMSEAERDTFTVRRVEFIGLTYTHDYVVRDRMTPLVQEGDLFLREKLVKSLQSISTLRSSINPLRMRDVVVQLDRSDNSVDMIICFKQKPRSKISASRGAAS
jgi:outer membrane protein assembly factor BamA